MGGSGRPDPLLLRGGSAMRTARFACVMLVFLLSALDLCRSDVSAPKQSKTVVQYQPGPIPGFPIINIRLNDKVTARFLLDTGTAASYISDKLAARLGLKPTPLLDANGHPVPLPNHTPAATVRVPLFQLGPVPFEYISPVVLTSEEMPGGEYADGIVGVQVLERFAVLLDPVKNEVTFWYPGNLSPEDRRQVEMQDATSVAIAGPDPHDLLYTTPVRVGDEQMDFVVDTGSVCTIIPTALAKRLALKPEGAGDALTLRGKITLNMAPVPRLSIESLPVTFPLVHYSDKEMPEMSSLLGMDLL